ncbi:unnamed protein product [Cuscuta epithymum]|uniref:SHSP domain-containing protein n=1 Tax=Cuscuta epithymum TaxID=186058 RepID=A0AAV0GEG0_9ASTE|nr:unnamed protein product [Cuscuta epithymum]
MGQGDESNGTDPKDHAQSVIDVAPLRSVPYTGPLPTYGPVEGCKTPSTSSEDDESSENASTQPAMVYFTDLLTPEEKTSLFAAASAKAGSLITGTALMGKVGHPIGAVDILESDTKYLFRVSLPGVSADAEDFHCNIEPNGKVDIRGITLTGVRAVYKHNMVFKMNTSNLCPPGKFTISFQLPGPIGKQHTISFGSDGILEATVDKKRQRSNS